MNKGKYLYWVIMVCSLWTITSCDRGLPYHWDCNLTIANPDGSGKRIIANERTFNGAIFQFTPDNQNILYITYDGGLGIMDCNGYSDRNISSGYVGGSNMPQVTSDSKIVVFDKTSQKPDSKERTSDIVSYNIMTGIKNQITVSDNNYDYCPALTSNQEIYYCSKLDSENLFTIYCMDLSGHNRTQIIQNDSLKYDNLIVSSDNQELFYFKGNFLMKYELGVSCEKKIIEVSKTMGTLSISTTENKLLLSGMSGSMYIINTVTLEKQYLHNGYAGVISKDGNYIAYQESEYTEGISVDSLNSENGYTTIYTQTEAGGINFSDNSKKIIYFQLRKVGN